MYRMEIWRDIKGYEGLYQVSNLGRVRSLNRIDSLGRWRCGKIKATVDRQEAKVYFERVKDVKIILHRLAVNIDGLLRKFILSGGFDIKA